MQERQSLIVYFKNPKVLKRLNQYGHVRYYHKKRKYAVLYVDADQVEKLSDSILKLRHIRRIEPSLLDQSAYTTETEEVSIPDDLKKSDDVK